MGKELEKIKLLEEASKTLKSEFIGLDDIIDDVIKAVKPWFVTPAVNERPVIISLFGMTGTGKTSLVRRLLDLLHINKKIFFDCGEEANDNRSDDLASKIKEYLNIDEDAESDTKDKSEFSKDLVFTFDEFQYARTIDESGKEVMKSNMRTLWQLLDSGIIDFIEMDWNILHFTNFVEDFAGWVEAYGNTGLDRLRLSDKAADKALNNALGLFYYGGSLIPESDYCRPNNPSTLGGETDDKEKEDSRLTVLSNRNLGCVLRGLKRMGKPTMNVLNDLYSITSTAELVSYLTEIKTELNKPKSINCSHALVFILGNLDEAFTEGENITPDIDPDVFYKNTSKVTIADIKSALKQRIRPEQIARLGNTIIKYPTLKGIHFRQIIEKEVGQIMTRFEQSHGLKVSVEPDIIDLLYSEGVYPTQGVRPLFTTISTLLVPYLSDIIVGSEEGDEVVIGVKEPETGYYLPTKTITLTWPTKGKTEEHEVKLVLGALRDPSHSAVRYAVATHEIGHALLIYIRKGILPISIVAVTSEHKGGFCLDASKEEEDKFDFPSVYTARSEIMICLAGYEAEREIFGDESSYRLLGSTSDIDKAWSSFSNAVYLGGYYEPVPYQNDNAWGTPQSYPDGYSDSIPNNKKTGESIREKMYAEFCQLREETRMIIKDHRGFIKEVAIALGNKGRMTGDEFEMYIKKWGIEAKPFDNDFYLNTLKS